MPGGSAPPDGVRRVRAILDPTLEAVLDELTPLGYDQRPVTGADDVPAHVRAASAIRRSGTRLVIVQDDVNVLAFHHRGGRTEAVLLPAGEAGRRVFDARQGNKRAKMDLEACAALPDGRLVAFGSGSTPRRDRLVVVAASESPRIVEAGDLYESLRERTAFAGSELNVEGAVVVDGAVRLFQRGNGAPAGGFAPVNATGDLPLPDFLRWLDGQAPVPPLTDVVQYDLGSIEGVPYTFTDAALTADGSIAFLACAEASPDTYRDGEVRGCLFGTVVGREVRTAEVRNPDGSRVVLKLEGIEARPDDGRCFDVVADPDRPEEPALLGRLTVRGATDGSRSD